MGEEGGSSISPGWITRVLDTPGLLLRRWELATSKPYLRSCKRGHTIKWVEDIKAGEHKVFVSSSPTGWSNDDVGLAWLEQVFDRYTKQRSGRWRLLILDGHGSHVTMEFIDYCDRHRIFLIILPPIQLTRSSRLM
jgi:hypothetical protein